MTAPALALDRNACCESVAVEMPVTVGGTDGHIYGVLNIPPDATTVQVLVHGWTYGRRYFDSPFEPDRYSYVRAANKNGYATLAIDRLGAGCSLHPLSLFDTLDNHVAVVHQAVQALREGTFGHTFDKVVLVGHSLGSIISATTAGRHPEDADALITTGYAHLVNSAYAFPTIIGRDYLAAGDPQWAAMNLDPLYMSSIPGARYTFYRFKYTQSPIEGIGGRGDSTTGEYELLNADPKMVEADEKFQRDTGSLTQFVTALPTLVVNDTAELNIPVLAVTGDHEPFFCGAGASDCTTSAGIVEHEKQFYAPGAPVHGYSVPGTGHDIHLEYTSSQASKVMLEFVDEFVGRGSGKAGSIPGVTPTCVMPEPIDPPLPARLLNQTFTSLVLPLINTFAWAVDPLPGLGDAANPLPVVTDLLIQVNKIVTDLLGKASADLK